ncbi:MAG: PAS domain-containing protein [Isosphaeraceae bacterium]
MTNREAREGPESSPQSSITANAINAHLLEETRLLRQRNSELIRELTEMRTSSQSARAARQAALNLMEDLQAARRAERREIAERLRAEQDRRSSEVKYRKLFESIDEGFLILERLRGPGEGPPDFRIVEANPASEKESGVRDAAGKTLREAFPGEAEDWYGIFDRIATTGEPIRTQYHLASGGGSWSSMPSGWAA